MGSKKLKAVVVKGGQEVPLPDSALAKALRKKWAGQLMGEGVEFKVHGTTSRTIPNTVIGDTPIKNWVGTYPEDYSDPSLDRIDENAFYAERDKPYGCWHCHIRCGGHLKAKAGPGEGQPRARVRDHRHERSALPERRHRVDHPLQRCLQRLRHGHDLGRRGGGVRVRVL